MDDRVERRDPGPDAVGNIDQSAHVALSKRQIRIEATRLFEHARGKINADDRPPEDVPAKRITVLADRAAGRVVVAVRFGSEEDLRRGAAALEAMSPPDAGQMRRVSVDTYEVVLERETP